MPSHPSGSNNPPHPPRAVCGDPRAAGVGVRLTHARRAFLEAATVHPVLWAPNAPHDFHAGDNTICLASGRELVVRGFLQPIMQGEFAAELWDGPRLLGYRYRLTAAGRAVVAGR